MPDAEGPRGRRGFLRLGGGAALAALLPYGRPRAAAGDYLAGERLRVVIASDAGSGNDAVARLFTEHLRPLLPDTEITLENIGGGGGRLAEKLLFESPPDGLTIAFLRSSMFYRILYAPQDYPYDLSSFSWLGSLSRERRVLLTTLKSGIVDLESLRAFDGPVRLALDSVSATSYQEALYLNVMLGTRLTPVPGYDGGGRNLAILNGEVEGRIANYESVLPLIEAGAATIALRINGTPLPPPFEGVALLHELPIDPQYDWLRRVMQAEADLGRIVAAAPGVPPERLQRLTELFFAVAGDPDFRAAALGMGLLVEPRDGATLQAGFAELPPRSAETVAKLEAMKACGLRLAEGAAGCAAP